MFDNILFILKDQHLIRFSMACCLRVDNVYTFRLIHYNIDTDDC